MLQSSVIATDRKRPQRRLVAILAADIVGYSRLMEADERETLNALMRLRRKLVDPAIAEYGGRLIKTTGDGFLVEYPSVVDAVLCAIAIQQGVAAAMQAASEASRLVFRIGINAGDVLSDRGGDIFGDGVNLAARIESLCRPGGVCVSAMVREQLHGKLPLALVDRGDQFVKNISRPIRVFDVPVEDVAGFALASAPGEGPAPRRRRNWVRTLYAIVSVICLALMAAGGYVNWLRTAPAKPARDPAPAHAIPKPPDPVKKAEDPVVIPGGPTSLAVLPFGAAGSAAGNDDLADVVADDLTTDFSAGVPDLTVMSRDSAATYKGRAIDAGQVGRDLGARYLLGGTLRRGDGGTLHAELQLVDTAVGKPAWTGAFDGTLASLKSFEDQIADRVSDALRLRPTARTRPPEQPVDAATADIELRARAALLQPTTPARLEAAEAGFRRILASDPQNVDALAGLGRTLTLRSVPPEGRIGRTVVPAVQEAADVAGRALALDPKRPGPHAVLGQVYRGFDRNAEAAQHFRAEIALNRNAAASYGDLGGALTFAGKPEDAISALEKALQLDPRGPDAAFNRWRLGRCFFALGQYDRAIANWEKARAADPRLAYVPLYLASGYALAGNAASAKAALAEALRLDPTLTIGKLRLNPLSEEPYHLALSERLYDGLGRAGLREE